MNVIARLAWMVGVTMIVTLPHGARGQSFVLDPLSSSLTTVPATAGDILFPSGVVPAPPAAPPPSLGRTAASLGLLPGDVIDGLSFFDDAALPGGTLYFSVDRASTNGGAPIIPPDVGGEAVFFVPGGTQGEAASDIFSTNDPVCVPFGLHNQVVDGNGVPIGGPPSPCGWAGFGLGLAEGLAAPPPPFNDNLRDFDWGLPGRSLFGCSVFSLAPGSPTLTPGNNPLLLAGAEPGDLLGTCPGPPPFLFTVSLSAALGLVSAGPGCAPPACDDIDAVAFGGGIYFSLAPGSPTAVSPAAILGPGPAVVVTPAMLGLTVADNVDGLEVVVNPCPVGVGTGVDAADRDGVGGCDNCPLTFNPGQEDTDSDFVGDLCDPCTDADGDGFGNPGFPNSGCGTDLCPFNPGPNADPDGDGRADECDNCPLAANLDQADGDFDGIGDVCDACPHVNFFAFPPAPFTLVKKVNLGYKSTGPGSNDDKPKITKAVFATATTFDPDTVDNVHVTLQKSPASGILFTASLTSASTLWTQSNPAKKKWKFKDPAAIPTTGVKTASIKESPTGSGSFNFKMGGKLTNIAGPLALTDDITVTVEIEPAGGTPLCFSSTLTTCTNKPTKDSCKP